MNGRSLVQRVIVYLYEFSWRDAIVAGVTLAVVGFGLFLVGGSIGVVGYVGNFLFSLGLFAVLMGALWGVVSVGVSRIVN